MQAFNNETGVCFSCVAQYRINHSTVVGVCFASLTTEKPMILFDIRFKAVPLASS